MVPIAAVAFVASPKPAAAQQSELTIPVIMQGEDFVGHSPTGIHSGGAPMRGGARFDWSPDGRHIYFEWQAPDDTAEVVYRVRRDGRELVRLEGVDPDTIVAGPAVWDRTGRRALYVIDGDIVLWQNGSYRRLLRTPSFESDPVWASDGESILFDSGGQVWRLDLQEPGLAQLTDIRGVDPREPEEIPEEGQEGFLHRQQQQLFEFLRENIDNERYWWNNDVVPDTARPVPFYVGEGKSAGGVDVTPDGQWAVVNVFESASGGRRVDMPVWVTDDGYTETVSVRTKVGEEQGTSRVAVIDLASGEATFVGDSIAETDYNVRAMSVSPNSRHVLLRISTHDNEHRWYAVVDLPTLETRVIDHLHDEAWIGGPGSFTAGFLPNGETVYFVSEATGYAHLYTTPASGGATRQLTSGDWEVIDAELSRDGSTWYITGNRDGYADIHFYTLPSDGGDLTQITTATGRQDAVPSPDGRWLAMTHSEATQPGDLYVQENRAGREMVRVTDSRTDEFKSFEWVHPEIIEFTASDGVSVPARIYRPENPNGAGVVFVHGAGYLQNVHNWWSGYFREYMFHHILRERGYTVLDIDYRGSAGHGRDWRTAIYRFMGGRDLQDQVDGARYLVDHEGVDENRLGIYGGSYGGFIVLMAMFTEPGVFQAGAGLRSVTDWAHYNHGYTSNILNEPQNDSLAYIRSSPIYHAEGLEGHLLMLHGMLDDNVHFSDVVRLSQRLIELGKENWELAVYPVERHGFTEPSSWTDEYRRILSLFERTLLR